jgi:hypothetical protein
MRPRIVRVSPGDSSQVRRVKSCSPERVSTRSL